MSIDDRLTDDQRSTSGPIIHTFCKNKRPYLSNASSDRLCI